MGLVPTTPKSYTSTGGRIQASTYATNRGANAQQVQVAFAFAQQLSTSIKFGKKFTLQEKAKVSFGLPFIGDKGAWGA